MGIPSIACSMNSDRSVLTINVQARYTHGGHHVKHSEVRRDNVIRTVIVEIEGPARNAKRPCVMQNINKTIEIQGPFAAKVTVNGPNGATYSV